jgi:hypothetical protein
MRYLCIVFLQIQFSFSLFFSQNESFRIISEKIDPICSTNYEGAKKIFQEIEEKYQIDPAEKLLFLKYSLENNDIRYFKSSMKKLIKNNGYNYAIEDSKFKQRNFNFIELIRLKEVESWLIKKSEKYYPIWIKNHQHAFSIKLKIDQLIVKDQMRGYFCRIYDQDSTVGADKMLAEIDYSNFRELLILADENGILPNHIDHGIGTYYSWQGILLHNLKTVSGKDYFLKIWEEILPYIEKTYFSGKIGYDLFQLYDQFLAQNYGYQYYGFEKNVPVFDLEHLEDRKIKYGFL